MANFGFKLKESLKVRKITLKKPLGIILISLGFLLIVFGYFFDIVLDKLSIITRQTSDLVLDQTIYPSGNLTRGEFVESQAPTSVKISDLSLDVKVKPAKVVGGKWEVFSDSASFGMGSALPGKRGNQVIFAHARSGLFLPLRSVKPGMNIIVYTDGGGFSYRVNEVKEVFPSETRVISQTSDETLTLYTCSGFADAKRLIVVAKREYSWSQMVSHTSY